MAHARLPLTDDRPVEATSTIVGTLVSFFCGLAEGFDAWRRYKTLERASDQELRALGITREGIARYVFLGERELF